MQKGGKTMNEMQLDLIRQGKCPIQFDADGKPLAAHYPIFELMRFLSALADGYMRLYNSKLLREKMERARRRELER
jgi:hypothetical protein